MSQLGPTELATLNRLKTDFEFFAQHCLRIRTKAGGVEPFLINPAQRILQERLDDQIRRTGKVRAIVVKARQQGSSTYIGGRFFWKTVFGFGLQTAVMTHEQDATDALFDMTHRFHEHMPAWLKPRTVAASAKELKFADTESGYVIATAGNRAAGRGRTLQMFHGSEAAFWPNADEHLAGIGQAVPDMPGTEVILESTAKGMGNMFHRAAMAALAGKSEFEVVFIPWFVSPEYRRPVPPGWERTAEEEELAKLHNLDDEQLAFRRNKIESDFQGDLTRWSEEYPATVEEAFQSEKRETFVPVADVLQARRHVFGEPPSGALIVGVDPARFGDDRTALCWRKGRAVERMSAKQGLTTMQVAGLVVEVIRRDNPARVCIDVIGLGAGVYDRLVELGYGDKVVAVNVAERADDPDRYRNKRAELWARMRQWLHERPVSIPDHDALAQDLLQPGYTYDSHGRIQLESKDDIKKRGAPSPDLGDALALTFAVQLAFENEERPEVRAVPNIAADAIGGY